MTATTRIRFSPVVSCPTVPANNDQLVRRSGLTTFTDTVRRRQPRNTYNDTNVRRVIGRLSYAQVRSGEMIDARLSPPERTVRYPLAGTTFLMKGSTRLRNSRGAEAKTTWPVVRVFKVEFLSRRWVSSPAFRGMIGSSVPQTSRVGAVSFSAWRRRSWAGFVKLFQ